jgi:transketolase
MMRKILIAVSAILLSVGWFAHSNAPASNDRRRELEIDNRELKEKLDNIQEYVTQAKSDLDDVESAVDTDDSCNETSAASDASDVEDKVNEIETEASYWERFIGASGRVIGMKTFGASAPLKELQRKFGFEPDRVVALARELLGRG